MPKIPSKNVQVLQEMKVNEYVLFSKDHKKSMQKALNSFRTIEHRKHSGKVMTINGNEIKRIA